MAFKRFAIAFDLHGDQGDTATVNAFHRFCRDFKPQTRIIGGDLWDFRALRIKASEEEKRESLKQDFADGCEFIEQFRPDFLLLGNHDARLWELGLRAAGPMVDLSGDLVDRVDALSRRIGFRILPYDKGAGVIRLGQLNVLHGFFMGVGATRKHAEIYGPCVFGHIHAADHVVLPSWDGRREAWSSPCLAKCSMEYNRRTPFTLRYSNGWVYGIYNDKSYHVEIAEVKRGTVVVASDLKVLAA